MRLKVRMKSRHGINYLKNLSENVTNSVKDLYQSKRPSKTVLKTTLKVTPMKTGQLRRNGKSMSNIYSQQGFKFKNFIRFRAINPITGFNYAFMQEVHQYMHYTTPGTGSRYLQTGIVENNLTIFHWNIDAIEKGLNKGAKSRVRISRDMYDYIEDEDEQMRLGVFDYDNDF